MRLYNSMTRKKERFIPIEEKKVTMYNCGPTVYDNIHVGNARPLVVFDTLRRFFIYEGYDVDFVINFTDIDDKIIERANEEEVDFLEISNKYIEAFKEVAKGLNLYDYEIIHPRATEYIEEMIDFIKGLIDKKAAYESNGSVYFRVDSYDEYGKLSKKKLDDLMSGARVDVNDEKENPMDFVMWKKAKANEPYWESPWGKGRPGWHIECSAMSKSILGDTIDIHSGGVDLQFPHHENEIAQSESLHDKTFANYWLHNGMLTIEDEKMSKSLGNFFTVKEISEEVDLEVLRFFLLSSHYRGPINFSREIIKQTKNGLDRLYNGKKNLEHMLENNEEREVDIIDQSIIDWSNRFKDDFIDSMRDDLNTADAISHVYELVKFANSHLDSKSNKKVVEHIYKLLMELTNVLGILSREDELLDEDIQNLIEERNKAREDKNYQKADEIRDQLLAEGIILEDTKDGVIWKRK